MQFLKFYQSFTEIFSLKQKKEIYILLFYSIIAMGFEALSIVSIFPFLNYVFGSTENSKYLLFINDYINPNDENYLFLLAMLFITIFLIKAIYLTYFNYKKNKFVYDVRSFQTNNLFNSYINENYLFHINTNSANLIRNLNDANLLSVFARSFIDLFAEVIMFIGILTFLLFISTEITLGLTIFFGLIGIIFFKLVQSKARKWGEESKMFRGLKIKNMKESFGAIKDIKILGKEKNFIDIFSFNNFQENEFTKKNSFIVSLPKIWFEWLAAVVMVFLIVLLTQNLSDKSKIIPILGIFALAAYRIIPSITKISEYLQNLKFCLPAVEPFIFHKKHLFDYTFKPYKNINEKFIFSDQILVENLTFKFPGTSSNVLEDLNLKIAKGEFIGIYGRSGAGKTTLINLLLGLLKPDRGRIIVGKNNIHDNLKSWHKIVNYIPQNVFITDDSIMKNIALGENNKDIDHEKINKSLKISNIFDFVKSLPNGVKTSCGELGERLSGGQKQRLGIARAFYKDSKILVFDEFTNFLDEKNEKKILEEVKNLKGEKTIVMISHKLSTLSHCDKLYKLEDKKFSVTNN